MLARPSLALLVVDRIHDPDDRRIDGSGLAAEGLTRLDEAMALLLHREGGLALTPAPTESIARSAVPRG